MKTKILGLCLISVCLAAPAADEPMATNTLSLDFAIGEALAKNPLLKAARASWEAMRERIPQARAWEDARIEFATLAGRVISLPANSMTDQRFAFEQAIPLSGKNVLRARVADADAVAAFEEMRRVELELILKTSVAYYRLANAYQQLAINEKNIALLKQFAEITRAKYEAGRQSQADVLGAETEVARLAETLFDFRRQISESETQLNVLMNRRADVAIARPETGEFEPRDFSPDTTEALALINRPELVIAQNRIAAAKLKRQLAQRDKSFPDPSVRLEASRYNGAAEPVGEVMAGISISLPWFNSKKYDAAIRESDKMREAAEHQLESLRTETMGLVRDQLRKIQTYHHHTELSRHHLLSLAEQTVTSKRLSYETDKAPFLELLMAQRNVREIEAMYWNHWADYNMAVAELEALTGTQRTRLRLIPNSTENKSDNQ
jgi:outer membrane protein TolC